MKKNELAKKSRKLLSAILTGTVLITSVVPESLIWAADVEMQEFEDGEDNEDVIFEAAEEPAEEPETEDVEESGEVGAKPSLTPEELFGVKPIQNKPAPKSAQATSAQTKSVQAASAQAVVSERGE